MSEIIIDLESGISLDNHCEIHYILEICENIKKNIDETSIIVTMNKKTLPKSNYKQKIVILISDENIGTWTTIREFPFYCGLFPVFRQYNTNPNIFDNQRVFPIPLGYNSTGRQMKQMYPDKPLSQRKYDFFYSGQYHGNRAELLDQLNKIKKDFNCIVNVTKGFREGYDIDSFYKMMGDTKISFAVVNESFRYYESMGSGCITIANESIDRWYYEGSPMIKLNSWKELTSDFINKILTNTSIDLEQEKIKKYYNEKISPEAVSNYIIEKTKDYYVRKLQK